MESIHFFSEGIDFNINNKTQIRRWLKSVILQHTKKITSLNYIFTSDDYLLDINQKYLNHNTYTDIITFDQSTNPIRIEADIYISIDRVHVNSKLLDTSFNEELHRVLIHGVLHLLGFKDKTATQKKEMRKKENHYLALRHNSIK